VGGRAGGTGSIGRDGGGGGMRAGGVGLNEWATGGRAGRRDTQGRASGAGSGEWVDRAHGDVGMRARGGAPGSDDRLDRWV
jgi:hypothetical protein